ncbi:(2Fe-2S) ferredoxin domain-containing protein [Natronomonas salsuginis]|uniref:(2Fe-2S) ferredoxin domain-containing protein n=1 Tax=Natronomonas salsuginis TaxID=2217661 RepID=A0A4V5ZNX9_9EURY|nr:(2Fe-2S) ferredoxin domain-containing protein [Natronomonas salsuginis]TKR25503.1 (2Fe-2S) ferredoxin domain-containing protein [Natronomonas salsuginis]
MKRRTDQQTTRLAAHVFVCVNDRDAEYACCADAGGEETTAAVKRWLRERDAFWSPVGVSTTDCLGLCSEAGTAITIQPQNEWYAEVRPEDVPGLLAEAFGPDAERVR